MMKNSYFKRKILIKNEKSRKDSKNYRENDEIFLNKNLQTILFH